MSPEPGRFHGRSFVSFLLAWSFLVLAVSGIVLFLSPQGRDAYWTNWTLLLTRDQWIALHDLSGWTFLILALVHLLYFNRRAFLAYLHARVRRGLNRRWELVAATAVAAVVVAGTLAMVPPFRQVMALSDQAKRYWATSGGTRAPYGHAELSSLAAFSRHIGLPAEEAAAALRAEGFEVPDLEVTIQQLADVRGVTPQAVYGAILKHHPEARTRGGGAGGQGRGQGGAGRGLGGGGGRMRGEEAP